jgi:DNA-directed RNA polymerase specialized sigma24 family protein
MIYNRGELAFTPKIMTHPSHLSPPQLAARCQATQPDGSHEVFCFELFRRAIAEDNSLCWQYLHRQYAPLVRFWINRFAPADQAAVDDLVQETLTTFLRAYTADKIAQAGGLGSVLAYLKSCAVSCALQARRTEQRVALESDWDEESIEAQTSTPSLESIFSAKFDRQAIWAAVTDCCSDERDQLLARLVLVADLKPREVTQQYPQHFATVDDVYRVKRNLLERLRRHPVLRAMREK